MVGEAIKTMLIVAGLTIVVSMLCALMIRGMVIALGAMSAKVAPQPAAAPRVAPIVVVGPPIAAITAAVYAVLGYHRIVHIEDARGHGWTAEGRLLHQASHNVPHHPHVDIR